MSFTYRGTTSDSMFFNVTERQVYNAPAFDVNAIEVPGRSGDVLNSQQRFKNKTLVYTGFIRSSDFPGNTQWERLSRGLRNIKAWICGDAGKYHDLTDDYDPGFIRRAFVSGETAINILFDRPDGATITITFMAEPFMYEESDPIELPETGTASGAIASFEGVAAPLQSLKFYIEPVQDLHGYDYPWPAGGGKNKYNGENVVFIPSPESSTRDGITLAKNLDGSFRIYGTATAEVRLNTNADYQLKAGKSYTISVNGLTNGNIRIVINGNVGGSGLDYTSVYPTSDFSKTYTIVENTGFAYFFLDVQNGATVDNTIHVQIEEGQLTAWTPYSNICPISGWSEVEINHSDADTSDPETVTVSLGQTVYGGMVDALAGKCYARPYYASYSGQALVGPWISSHDKYVAGGTPTTGAQVVDMGGTETTISLTPVSVNSLLGQNNIWCNTGDTEVVYVEPTENPTEWPSKPRLEITMAGAGTLAVNGKTWSIGAYTGTLICDSEIMDWYDAGALKNSLVSGDGFPELVPGDNVITYTGGITKVVAKPRWRTL